MSGFYFVNSDNFRYRTRLKNERFTLIKPVTKNTIIEITGHSGNMYDALISENYRKKKISFESNYLRDLQKIDEQKLDELETSLILLDKLDDFKSLKTRDSSKSRSVSKKGGKRKRKTKRRNA
jgi:hypothetical protein